MENKEEFRQLYNKLYSENFSELDKIRQREEEFVKKELDNIREAQEKKYRKFFYNPVNFLLSILLATIVILIETLIDHYNPQYDMMDSIVSRCILGATVIYDVIFMILLYLPESKDNRKNSNEENLEYFKLFKENIVKPIIGSVLENSEYNYDGGLTEEEYTGGDWEPYDRYSSEDRITAEIIVDKKKMKLIMSEVQTMEKVERKGKTYYMPVFCGIAGYINLPKHINCYLKVTNTEWFTLSKNNLEMDMAEFEKIFDVKTDDRIKAMQILTVDIMSELIELIKQKNVKFEFYINNNRMYIRFHIGRVFESYLSDKTMQYEQLKKYFDVVSSVKSITEHICNVIMNTEL